MSTQAVLRPVIGMPMEAVGVFPKEAGAPSAIDVSRRGDLALKLLSGADDATWPMKTGYLPKLIGRRFLRRSILACGR